jgi:hypothetical protein
VWYGEGVKEKLGLKGGYLSIIFFCFNRKKTMMNSEIIVFFKCLLFPEGSIL